MRGRKQITDRPIMNVQLLVPTKFHKVIKNYCKETNQRIKEYYLHLAFKDMLKRNKLTPKELHDMIYEEEDHAEKM